MQTPILSVQPSNTGPAPQAKPAPAAGAPDHHDFQRTLTRQIEQRQAQNRSGQTQAKPVPAPPATAPTKPPPQASAPTKPPPVDTRPPSVKEVQPDAAQPEQSAAVQALPDQAAATPPAPVDAAQTIPAVDISAVVSNQVADMLALVTSLNQAIAPSPVAVSATATVEVRSSNPTSMPPPDLATNLAAQDVKAMVGALATTAAKVMDAGKNTADASAGMSVAEAGTTFAAIADAAKAASGAAPATAGAAPAPAPVAVAVASDKPIAATTLDAAQLSALKTGDIKGDKLPQLHTAKEPAPAPETAINAAPLQQTALQVAVAASALPADKLSGRVGTPVWDQQVGQKIVWMVAGGEQSATLTLNPPDLGPLQVVLRISNEQTDVSFTAAQPEVRQALEAAMPRLREMLGDAGIQLGNSNVSSGMSNQQDNEARAGRSSGGGQGGGSGQGGDTDLTVRNSEPASRGSMPGMVDTFA